MTLYRLSGGPLLRVSGGGLVKAGSGGGGGESGKAVLSSSDFTYLGYYDIDLGGSFCFGQGLTHRYVGGQLRFLAMGYNSGATFKYPVSEFAAPGSFGSTISTETDDWAEPWGTKFSSGAGRYIGMYWDPVSERLWATSGVDYPDDAGAVVPYAIAVGEIASGGVVTSVRGRFGLHADISARRIYGGIVPVPSWFQTAHGTGAYAVGFGGYTSRMVVGPGSMGPALFAIDDPTSLSDEAVFGTGNYHRLVDHVLGTSASTDWYTGTGATVPTTFDRGVRSTASDYTNYMNNGLNYQSLGRAPIPGTDPVGDWNEAPDGLGRWLWTDSAFQTGVWIDLPTKHGFVIVPSLVTGKVWYQSSDIQYDGRTAEFQVFDPDHFGECIAGSRQPWDVKPTNLWRPDWATLVPNFASYGSGSGGTTSETAAACTFDSTTGRLYLRWTFANGTWPYTKDRILVWQVA